MRPALRLSFFFLLCASGLLLHAQSRLGNDIEVTFNGSPLPSAWSGGLDLPQFGMTDIDRDGKPDLIVYDWRDDSFTAFLNEGNSGQVQYVYSPQYRENLSACHCDGWIRLVDYTGDGLEDLVCGNNGSVLSYKQVLYPGDSVGFELHIPAIKTRLTPSGNWLGLPYLRTDVPGLEDLDGDGDLDFLAFSNFSNYVDYYKNVAFETYGRTDTLLYLLERTCWGHFSENDLDNSVRLHDTTSLCLLGNFSPKSECGIGGRPASPQELPVLEGEKHLGSSILILDFDADQVMDAIVGDLSFNNTYALHNCGRQDYAYIDTAEINFPASHPINVPIFPACFLADIDNDGARDLLIGPHSEGPVDNLEGSTWYRNHGQDNMPDFRFAGKGLLQQDGLEFGSRAVPVFLDHNDDGLMDLIVGNGGYFNDATQTEDRAGLALLENTGTAARPAYTLMDTNYLGLLGGHPLSNLLQLAPAAGDLDGDGDPDLLLGEATGALYYFRNVAAAGDPANFMYVPGSQFELIDVQENSAPHLVDLDGDQDLDLLIGNKRGRIAFYRNEGSAQNPNFVLVTNEWGFLVLGNGFNGDAKPLIWDVDGDQAAELLLGTEWGEVRIYEGVNKALTDTLQYVGNLFSFNFGSYTAPSVAHLDTSGIPSYVVGIGRGGLLLHHNPLPADTAMTAVDPMSVDLLPVQIYPNPTLGDLSLEFEAESEGVSKRVFVYNLLGQLILSQESRSTHMTLDLGTQAPGVYLIHVMAAGRQLNKKVVVGE